MTNIQLLGENASDSGVSPVKIFENAEFGQLDTILLNGEPWFVGKEVSTILGYANPSESVLEHVDEEDRISLKYKAYSRSLLASLWNGNDFSDKMLINESGIYSLILRSNLEKAKSFKRWITSEVLPSIRKTGSYSIQEQLPKTYLEALKALVAAEEEKERLALENAEKQRKIEEQAPKVQYFDNLVERNLLTNFRDTAKEIGLKQNQLINLLLENGYLYRDQRNKLKPYAEHVPDYFEIKDYENNGHTGTQTLVTPKGKEAFRLLFGNGLK